MADSQEAQVKLYWLDRSRAQNILWLLEELNIKYDVEIFHRNPQTMLAPKELRQVHPLGKAPVIEITPPGPAESFKLAETGFIIKYLCDHFPEGKRLVPEKWKPGKENTVGGETEGWMRHEYLLHYIEGSLFPTLTLQLILGVLKSDKVPFFIRPFTTLAVNQLISMVVFPNMKRHFAMIDDMLSTSPGNGPYICGPTLSAADIMLSFALIASEGALDSLGTWPEGSAKATHPRIFKYIERLKNEPGYAQSADKIRELDGDFVASLKRE